jgi:TfuA-like protein
VAHAPAADDYRSLSDAMVNIRAGLRDARDAGCITVASHDRLVAAAKDLFYPDRSWPRLYQQAAAIGIADGELQSLRAQIARKRPDVKRADAIRLLQTLAADTGATGGSAGAATAVTTTTTVTAPITVAPAAGFDFEPTFFWEQMILNEAAVAEPGAGDEGHGERGGPPGAGDVSAAGLRRHVRVHGSRADEVLSAALLLYLADEQASRRGFELAVDIGDDDATTEAAVPAIGDAVGLLSPADREILGRGRRATGALQHAVADQVNRRLSAALAHLGRLETTLAEVRHKQAILRSLGLRAATPADAGLSLDFLLDWYQRRFGPLGATPEAHAMALGFTSFEEFVGEIALEYLAASEYSLK